MNAYDFDASPGGSSAGSGVATSMAFATAAIGTETSGSILNPSQADSLVGVKTTHGLDPDRRDPSARARASTCPARWRARLPTPRPSSGALTGGDYTTGLSPTALEGVRLAYDTDARGSLGDDELALFDDGDRAPRAARRDGRRRSRTRCRSSRADASWRAIPNEFKASLNRYLAEEMPSAEREDARRHRRVQPPAPRPDEVRPGPARGLEPVAGARGALPGAGRADPRDRARGDRPRAGRGGRGRDHHAGPRARERRRGSRLPDGDRAARVPGGRHASPSGSQLPRADEQRARPARLCLRLRAGRARARPADRREPRARAGPCAAP